MSTAKVMLQRPDGSTVEVLMQRTGSFVGADGQTVEVYEEVAPPTSTQTLLDNIADAGRRIVETAYEAQRVARYAENPSARVNRPMSKYEASHVRGHLIDIAGDLDKAIAVAKELRERCDSILNAHQSAFVAQGVRCEYCNGHPACQHCGGSGLVIPEVPEVCPIYNGEHQWERMSNGDDRCRGCGHKRPDDEPF